EDPRRGEYLKWVVFQSTGIDAAMTQASVKFEIPRSHAGWGSTEVVVGVLRQRLARADPYLFGSWFTAADLLLGMGLSWGFQFGLFPEHPELTRFAARVRERPAVERALSNSHSESTET
ncbi:MAG: glutathione binding-like protein, partial [Myxococcota bacterium]